MSDVEKERAAIVKWIRKTRKDIYHLEGPYNFGHIDALHHVAHAIERGDHHKA